MQKGTIEIIRDGLSPFQSPNTRLIAAARACGFNYGTEKPFMDSVEEKEDGTTERNVTWVMNGDEKMPFIWATEENGKLVAHKEEITFDEFRKRYTNLDWVKANPDHPISYLRGSHWHHTRMLKLIKDLPQHEIFRRGKRIASVPRNATKAEMKKVMKFIGR